MKALTPRRDCSFAWAGIVGGASVGVGDAVAEPVVADGAGSASAESSEQDASASRATSAVAAVPVLFMLPPKAVDSVATITPGFRPCQPSTRAVDGPVLVGGRMYVRCMEADRGDELIDQIARLEAERARVEARISATMLELADLRRAQAEAYERGARRELAAGVVADELALVLAQPTRTVQVRLAEARRVRGSLPLVWAAHRHGRIDAWRVRLVGEAAARLHEPSSLRELDVRVVEHAPGRTAAQLRAWLRRFVARVEPQHVELRRRREHSQRGVWFQYGDDGNAWMHAQLTNADALRVDRLLSAHAHRRAERETGLTVEQARADVLADVVLGRVDADDRPTGRCRVSTTVVLTVPVRGLVHDDDGARSIDGSVLLPPDVLRELTAEPGTLFHRALTDPVGDVLEVTELGRFPSRRLADAVRIRDGQCAFPTCSRPATDCDLDHEVPHPRGPTSAANLRALCRRHHRLKGHGLLPAPRVSRAEHHLAVALAG